MIILLTALSLPARSAEWLRYPALSPDGKTIVFTHGADLYTVPTSGGEARQLTQHVTREFHPLWSPDSQQIAFASDRHGNHDVFIIPCSGGTARRLTHHSNDDLPWSFSADGSAVIFSSTRLDSATTLDIPNGRAGESGHSQAQGGKPT